MSGTVIGGASRAAVGKVSMRNSTYNATPKALSNVFYFLNAAFWRNGHLKVPACLALAYIYTNTVDPSVVKFTEWLQGEEFVQRRMWDCVEMRAKKRLAAAAGDSNEAESEPAPVEE